MAKRKRLTPPMAPVPQDAAATAAGSAFPPHPVGTAKPGTRAPIAQVAGEAAAQSALDDLAGELLDARRQGRLVQSVPLAHITADHLVRDRMVLDDAEMDSLKASLAARGQQTPIEVVEQAGGTFGLISGWRRLQAMRSLYAETESEQFATIKALIKPIDTVSDSYVAMVEENEIRAGLSFYERAHLAAEAVRLGVYASADAAVQVLFANAVPAKRSKIKSFVVLHEALGQALQFPAAIPERLGLALVGAMKADPQLARRLRDALRKTPPADAAAERRMLERAMQKAPSKQDAGRPHVAGGVTVEARQGRLILSGKGVTADLRADLMQWLAAR